MSAKDGGPARGAFSLIELVTVITVLAVLAAAVGAPTLTYLATIRSRSAAARIASDLTYLQRLTMNSRQRTWALFDVTGNRYTLYVEDPANPGKANRQLLRHPLTGETGPIQLGSGDFAAVSLTSASINATSELEFDSLGKPFDGNGAVLPADATISFNNGVTLTIRPVSGLVEQKG